MGQKKPERGGAHHRLYFCQTGVRGREGFVLKKLILREWWSVVQENPGGRMQMFRAVVHDRWCSLGINQVKMVFGL